jgi:hypothetical protein
VQLVVADAKLSAGQAPLTPVHISATSHWPVEGRHVTVSGTKTSIHVSLVPEQWSLASSSHTPPWDVPTQLVVGDSNSSAGQAPLTPVHISATSHWPVAGRHVTVSGANTSMHVSSVPEQ